MFGKKRDNVQTYGHADSNGNPWDEATIKGLQGQDLLSFRISYVERKFQSGPGAPYLRDPPASSSEVDIIASGYCHGLLQYAHVTVEIDRWPDAEFGYCSISWVDPFEAKFGLGHQFQVPTMHIKLSSRSALEGIVEAMRDALLSGEGAAEARIFCKIPENFGNQILAGETVTETFPVSGFICYSELRSPRSEPWGYPLARDEFSLEKHPYPWTVRKVKD